MKKRAVHILVWSCSPVLDMSGHCVPALANLCPFSSWLQLGNGASPGTRCCHCWGCISGVVVYSPCCDCAGCSLGQAVNPCPSAEARCGHTAWACPHGTLGCVPCVCSAALASCSPWVLEELDGSCISLSRFLLGAVDSHSTRLQSGTRARSCVLWGAAGMEMQPQHSGNAP